MEYMPKEGPPLSVEEIFQTIKSRILSLDLKPGQKISEHQLCAEYSCSRGVVRTAISRLVQLGLAAVYPQRGTFVSYLDTDYIGDLMLLRTCVEKEAAFGLFQYLTSEELEQIISALEQNMKNQQKYRNHISYEADFSQLDDEFHALILRGLKKQSILKIIEEPMLQVKRWKNFEIPFAHKMPALIEQHQAILDAVKKHDILEVQKALAYHLEQVLDMSFMAKETYPQYFL